ncbi:hypothetical protein O181_031853 [Austropuccinia psidii MF-1]|uniref:Uncharacterized protein n=1 Tax=Austropuccinia psidii MF-1 TaxID=1389203 RepID=A0A9Q3CYC1_9BASI|nr:hypothetical protein [Austropuccinia psidii MF-1]
MEPIPEGTLQIKNAFKVHISLLWGLIEDDHVPASPDHNLLQDFYCNFASNAEILTAVENPFATYIIPPKDVITLKKARLGPQKIGHGIVKIEEFFAHSVHITLAKLGIQKWGPDLNEAVDSLLNDACRISAIKTFQQIAATGAYEYMNVNRSLCNNWSLLCNTYNHFVHFVMFKRSQNELREGERTLRANAINAIQMRRERLQDARKKYALTNNFPKRYIKVLDDINAHSDDEYIPNHRGYAIKTLPFRSKNANAFFRKLDFLIQQNTSQNGPQSGPQYKRFRPQVPIVSTLHHIPKGVPIDFYNPEYFNRLQPAQKWAAANSSQVAFLPKKEYNIDRMPNPDEQMQDSAFFQKYWPKLASKYDLSHQIELSDSESENGAEEEDSIDLDQRNEENGV